MQTMANSYITIKGHKKCLLNNGGYEVELVISDDEKAIKINLYQDTSDGETEIDELIQLLQRAKQEHI